MQHTRRFISFSMLLASAAAAQVKISEKQAVGNLAAIAAKYKDKASWEKRAGG